MKLIYFMQLVVNATPSLEYKLHVNWIFGDMLFASSNVEIPAPLLSQNVFEHVWLEKD